MRAACTAEEQIGADQVRGPASLHRRGNKRAPPEPLVPRNDERLPRLGPYRGSWRPSNRTAPVARRSCWRYVSRDQDVPDRGATTPGAGAVSRLLRTPSQAFLPSLSVRQCHPTFGGHSRRRRTSRVSP
jgi:hypothetical protein